MVNIKKFLMLSTMVGIVAVASTDAFAFGGIFGGGHKSHNYNGVNSIGVHIDANGDNTTPDITLVEPECNVDEDCDIYAQKCVNGTCESVCDEGSYIGENDGNPYCYPVSNGNCNKNADCNPGEYCAIQENGDDCAPVSGYCQSVADNVLPVSWNDQSFVRSKEPMTWWAADNFCRVQGKHMVHLRELGMTRPDGWCEGTEENCAGLTPNEWTVLITSLQLSVNNEDERHLWNNEGYGFCATGVLECAGAVGDQDHRSQVHFALCN